MAVEPRTEKSQPDVTKLNGFSGHTVTVTKHTAPRSPAGDMVVPTGPMPLRDILALQTSLPLAKGPGFYRFEVADTGGSGSDVWMTRLGPEIVQQEGFPMATTPALSGATASAAAPLADGVRHLGHGYFYDETMHALTTPWRAIVSWEPGQPFPTPPSTPAAPATSTPWNAQAPWQNPAIPPWAAFPVSDDSDKVKRLEAQIAENQRRTETEALRAEMRRQADETKALVERLVAAISAKPAGPSEEILHLQRENEETKRLAQESARDAQRRDEDRRRDEQHRAEMAAIKDTLHEATANRQDPMLPMLLQVITSSQQASANAVEAIQAATTAAAAAAQRQTEQMVAQLSGNAMKPIELMTLMQTVRGDAAEGAKAIVEGSREMMATQREFYREMIDAAGQGGAPWYAGAIQAGLDKVGLIGAAMAESRAQAQQQPQVQQVQQPMRVAPTQAQTRVPGQPQAQPARALSAAEMRERAAAGVEHFSHSPSASAGLNGAAGAAIPTSPVEVVPPPPPAAPVPSAPAAHRERRPRKQGRRARTPRVPVAAAPPHADPKGFSTGEMRGLSADDVRMAVEQFDDDALFGPRLLAFVQQLRASPPPAAEVAKYVLQGRDQLASLNETPPAMELLVAEQFDVLVERLMPGAEKSYHDAIVSALEELTAEPEEEEDGEEDEGEEEAALG